MKKKTKRVASGWTVQAWVREAEKKSVAEEVDAMAEVAAHAEMARLRHAEVLATAQAFVNELNEKIGLGVLGR